MKPARRLERGMTLIEALLAVILIGIITAAISGVLLVTIGPDQQASDRLAASHDTQLLSLYLPTDLQSAGDDEDDVEIDESRAISCGTAASTGRTVLWMQQLATGFEVAYVVPAGAPTELVRHECTDAGLTSVVVARHVAEVTAVPNGGQRYSLDLRIQVDDEAAVPVEISGTTRVRPGDLAAPGPGPGPGPAPACSTTTISSDRSQVNRTGSGPLRRLNQPVAITVVRGPVGCTGPTPTHIRFSQGGSEVGIVSLGVVGTEWRGTIDKDTLRPWAVGFVTIAVLNGTGGEIDHRDQVFEVK